MSFDEISFGVDVDVWHYPQIGRDAKVVVTTIEGEPGSKVQSVGIHR